MVNSSQISEHLALYLSKRISLRQFEDWFVPAVSDIQNSQSESAIKIAFAIEGALSEYLSHVLNENEFREELLNLMESARRVHHENQIVWVCEAPAVETRIKSLPAHLLSLRA